MSLRLLLIAMCFVTSNVCACDEQDDDWTLFKCDKQRKRYCTQMSSCTEATFHWAICDRKELDADKDNMPCESICPEIESRRAKVQQD